MKFKVSLSVFAYTEAVCNESVTKAKLQGGQECAATGQEAACNAITTCVSDQRNVPLHTKSEGH